MPIHQLGPYKIERILGRGGMGAVYAGLNEETGERAAIKVLSAALADDPGFRERFKAEIETLKKLRHPNIVQLYGYGEHEGHLFYAMELVEGKNLQDELQSGRKFTWREVCRIAIEICQGLKHAHDVGVIHRDLKPANLLITPDGVVKLSDFGIAKLYGMTHLTADGGVLGTADYMAPEQAEGRQATNRCDMYSLGSVLFALLARRPPFAASTLPEVLHALRYDEAPPVRRFAPQTPAELESLLIELLDKNPQNRIATPLVLSNRLRAMLHALSEDKVAPPPERKAKEDDEFEIRLQDSSPMPLSQRTTLGAGAREPESSESDVTFAPTPTRYATEAPASEAAKVSPPTVATSHFTVIDEKENAARKSLPPIEDEGAPLWGVAAAIGALVLTVVGLTWYFLRAPSADALYERIKTAAREEDPAQLSSAEKQIDAFLLDHSGDPRAEEVAAYQQEIAVYRLQRKLEFRARRLRGTDLLLPVEQAYLDAISYERSAPETAVARLQALIDLYGSDKDGTPTTRNCVDLARRQLGMLRERMARSGDEHRIVLTARLEEARELMTQDPPAARTILQGVVTLYSDKPWAAQSVAQARELLAKIETPANE
jgi:serine/threonine protein kinase